MTTVQETSDAIKKAGLHEAFPEGSLDSLDCYVFWIRVDNDKSLWLHALHRKTGQMRSAALRQPPKNCGRAGVRFVMDRRQWEFTRAHARTIRAEWRPIIRPEPVS